MKAQIGTRCYSQTQPGAVLLPGLPNLAMEVFRSRTGNLAMVLQALLRIYLGIVKYLSFLLNQTIFSFRTFSFTVFL